jgi:hypothetical protein
MGHANREKYSTDLPVDGVVWTVDNEELGTVKAVTPYFFHVDVPLAPDYWLPIGLVTAVEGSAVRLRIPKEELPAYQVQDPTEYTPVIAGLVVAEHEAQAESDRRHRSSTAGATANGPREPGFSQTRHLHERGVGIMSG